MVSSFFLPAKKFIGRFTFPVKFFLTSMLLAIPLVMMGLQSALDAREQVAKARESHQGVRLLQTLQPLVIELETYRDLSVGARIGNQPEIEQLIRDSQARALELAAALTRREATQKNQLFMLSARNLQESIEHMSVSTGSEGDIEKALFEKADSQVAMAYQLVSQVANEYGLVTDRDVMASQIAILLTRDFQLFMRTLGEARAYGLSFLSSQMLGSQGINLLNTTLEGLYSLDQQIEQRLSLMFTTHQELNQSDISGEVVVGSLAQVARTVEDRVLLAADLDTPWSEYWAETSASIQQLNQFRAQLLDFLAEHNRRREQRVSSGQLVFAASVIAIMSLFIYLFAGFYLSVRESLGRLSRAAIEVAHGGLDKKITVDSQDELNELARLFDSMRLQLKDRQERLLELSITDGLTGIRNRKYFNGALQQHAEQFSQNRQDFTLLLLDIDHFKKVNDRFGHQAGDLCLQRVASTLEKHVVFPEDILARYGGEEFAILLPATHHEAAGVVAEKLCASIRNLRIEYLDQFIPVTVSIGLACASKISDFSDEAIVRLADNALYQAKAGGRNRWVSAHLD